jgi:hypothetical protein
MRFAAFALMAGVTAGAATLGACSLTPSGSECHSDQQCGDDVCARSGECLARTSVREIAVRWTVNGEPASATTCASHPDLYLEMSGTDYGDTLRLPVSCGDGAYTFTGVPKRYVKIELGVDGGLSDAVQIDPSGQVQLDLLR